MENRKQDVCKTKKNQPQNKVKIFNFVKNQLSFKI